MVKEHLVNLLGIDVVPAGHDQVLLPVHDRQVAVLIEESDIAGIEPPVPENLGRLLGLLVIARHDLRPLDADLPRLARRQFLFARFQVDDLQVRVRQRDAHGPGLGLALPRGRHGKGHVFRQAINVVDSLPRQVHELLHGVRRQRCGAGEKSLDERQIHGAKILPAEEPHEDGGHAGKKGRPACLQHLDDESRFGAGDHDARPAVQEGEILADGIAGGVKDGVDPHQGLRGVPEVGEPGAELLDDRGDVGMGQHGPLAYPRGAPGIEEGRQVLPAGAAGHGSVRLTRHEIHKQKHPGFRRDLAVHFLFHEGVELLFGEREAVVDVAGDNGLDLRLHPQLQGPGQQEIQTDQPAGIGIVELVGQLAFLVEGIVHHRDGAQMVGGKVGDDELREVGQQHGHLVPGTDPQLLQRAGEAVDQFFQLPIGDPPAHEIKGRPVGVALGAPVEDLRHGDLFRDDFRGNPGGVRPVPDPVECHDSPPFHNFSETRRDFSLAPGQKSKRRKQVKHLSALYRTGCRPTAAGGWFLVKDRGTAGKL